MRTAEEVMTMLQDAARPEAVAGMVRYGINDRRRLGVSAPEMRRIARAIGRDHDLALQLWRTGIPEAMMVASLIGEPQRLTAAQMDEWVAALDSWDVCDQVCMNLFDKSPLAWRKVREWAQSDGEFVKRAAFALLACLAWHDKEASDEAFTAFLPLIEAAATDERNYVKKAVSWALRHIGKRNAKLNASALAVAAKLKESDSRSARWVGADALRELQSEAVQRRLGG